MGKASQHLSPPFKWKDLNTETWTNDFAGLSPYPKLYLQTEFDAHRVNNSRLTASQSINCLGLSASVVTVFLHPQSPFHLTRSKEQDHCIKQHGIHYRTMDQTFLLPVNTN